MPSSSIDLSTTLMYISICAFIDILSPGVLAVTAYMILSQPNQLSSRLLVFLFITQLGYITLGFFALLWWKFTLEEGRTIIRI